MGKQRKKQIKKYISWCLAAAVVAVLTFMPLIASGQDGETGPKASVIAKEVQIRDISTVILGGGVLKPEEPVEITVPAQVKLTEYLVKNGDSVQKGQPVAAVDRVTVMTAITQVQDTMEYLKEQISEAAKADSADTVKAIASGTVKLVYGREGERVQDVMLRDGAMAVLSLDGLMGIRIQRRTDLEVGDKVAVILESGREAEGRVESNLDGLLTVTLEDEGYAPGEKVTVVTEDGDRIGSGELYIHSQWNAVAYAGVISRVSISEGDTVSGGKILFDLEDSGVSPEFEMLVRQHQEYEALMLELFQMYQSERITAPADGIVTGVDDAAPFLLGDSGAGWSVSLLVNAPNGDDETAYINYIGRTEQVGPDSLLLMMNPMPVFITDYMDLSAVPMDEALMTESALYTADAPVYERNEDGWVQIEMSEIKEGDILLFAGDPEGNFVWVVRVKAAQTAPQEPESTEPEIPEEPDSPTDPTTPTLPNTPEFNYPQGGNAGPTGGFWGAGGMTQEDVFELYGLDTVTVASVIPQNTLTVTVTVDEQDVSEIYMGQPAVVTLRALTGEKFAAKVTGLSASGENSGGNSKFSVELTLEKSSGMLAGMNASVMVGVDTVSRVLSIPVAALVEEGTRTVVYTAYDAQTETYGNPVEVTVGISDGEFVQILSGLTEGQQIYYPYYDNLVISVAPEVSGGFPFG